MKLWFRKKRPHPLLSSDTDPSDGYLDLFDNPGEAGGRQQNFSPGLQGISPQVRLRSKPSARVENVSPQLTGVTASSHAHDRRNRTVRNHSSPSESVNKAASRSGVSPHILDASS